MKLLAFSLFFWYTWNYQENQGILDVMRMARNDNLTAARKARNDEFYTQLADIEKELVHYHDKFRDKVVFCNCDDPAWSNFWKYFDLNFDFLGLRGLIATHYDSSAVTYKLEIRRDPVTGAKLPPVRTDLRQDGDFRSPECVELLKAADVVVTNPPFSLFREYVALMMKYEKPFIIIGSMNAITYKEIFPLLKDDRVWLGYTSPKRFLQPDGSLKSFGNILWYTNVDIAKRHEPLTLFRRYADDPGRYPRYDNYDAIECSKVQDIPEDYFEHIGVPITFLEKYCPEQFEILGITKSWFGMASKVYGPQVQVSRDGGRKQVMKLNDQPALVRRPTDVGTYYECDGRQYVALYQRILIRRKV